MIDETGPRRIDERRGSLVALAAATLLLLAFAILSVSSMAVKSLTGDEVAHLPSGYTYVKTGDFRLNMQHPPLVKALAGVPLLALDLDPIETTPGWAEADEWRFGQVFLTENREPLRRLVFLARLPMVGLGVLLGVGLFLWARELWSDRVGLAVLLLYCFSPNLLAHTRLVTTDVGVTCFTVLALYALWRFSRSGSPRAALGCGLAVGLALLSKYTGIVTLGLVGILLIVLAAGRVARIVRSWDFSGPTLTRLVACGLLVLLVALAVVTVGFGFPRGLANYKIGFDRIYADHNPEWEGFLWGEYSGTGFRYYYLLAQLWKTPLPTLILLGWTFLVRPSRSGLSRVDAAFLLIPVAAFNAAGVFNTANIGIRHMLPAYPFLFLLCGIAAHSIVPRRIWPRMLLGGLCVWYVAGTLWVHPHYLPYFNALAGGPDGGIDYLDDSNISWGQDYWLLQEYLERERPEDVRLFGFNPVSPEVYGIEASPLTLRDVTWPRPGVTYVVGAHFLRRSSLSSEHSGLRFHWLGRYRPVDKIGWSLFVYRFEIGPEGDAAANAFPLSRAEWYADAEERLDSVLARSPDFEQARVLLAEVLSERAAWRVRQGLAVDGINDALRAMRLEPGNPVYRRQLDALRIAIRPPAVSGDPEQHYLEGLTGLRSGNPGQALVSLSSCLQADPGDARARRMLDRLYAQIGLTDRSGERLGPERAP